MIYHWYVSKQLTIDIDVSFEIHSQIHFEFIWIGENNNGRLTEQYSL